MGKLKDIFGTTSFIGQQHLDNTDKFKLQSYFVSNVAVSHRPNVYSFQQTHQGFDYDLILTQAKQREITTIFTTQGGFDFMNTNGSVYKRMPINETDNPLDSNSYTYLKELCFHVAARYGNNINADRYRIAATLMNVNTVPLAVNGSPLTSRANQVKTGLNLVDYIRVQNEYNFKVGWSGLTRAFDNNSYAVCLAESIKAIIDGDPNMKILLGGQISPDVNYTRELLIKLRNILGFLPNNLYLDFHYYIRNANGTVAITPEDANLHLIGQQYQDLTTEFNLPGFFCTESGYNNSSSTSPEALKQKAPLLQGFNLDQSAALLMQRTVLILGTFNKFKGITFYHSRDEYDSEPYTFTGLNTKSWQPKERRILCEEFLAQHGEKEVKDFAKFIDGSNTLYFVETDIVGGKTDFAWTNKTNYGGFTPMPKLSGDITPQPTLPQVEINITGNLADVDIQIL